MACALAPSWTGLLFFRLLCGISASAPIAIVGGVYADIYDDPVSRGLAMAIFMAVSFHILSPVQITLKRLGHERGTALRSYNLWIRLTGPRLALGILDRPHYRRSLPTTIAFYP